MKRLDKKKLNTFEIPVLPKVFIDWPVVNSNHRAVCFFQKKADCYKSLHLSVMETVELPLMDIYTVRANSINGSIVGYALDCYGKIVKVGPNFVVSTGIQFSQSKLKALNKKNVGLRVSYAGIFFYSYEGMGSFATTEFKQEIRDRFDLM